MQGRFSGFKAKSVISLKPEQDLTGLVFRQMTRARKKQQVPESEGKK